MTSVIRTPEYQAWNGIKTRCFNTKYKQWADYGGRGITMCARWDRGEDGKTGFQCFLEDMGPRPSPAHSIDRIDNDGHYEPSNCRWATRAEQARNRRWCRHVVVDGVERLATSVAEECGIPKKTFERRVRTLGWSVERALTTPVVKHANGTTYA